MNAPCCTERKPTRRPRPALRALGPPLLLLALGCGAPANRPAEEPVVRERTSGVATPPLKVGDPLPPLQAEGWLNGSPSAPGAPGVRLLVVDAWGLWCPFCAGAAPGLGRLYEKYSPQGVAFVSITNHERDIVSNFVRTHSCRWPHGYGATAEHVAALGAGTGMPGPAEYEVAPTLYLVGPDGRVRWIDGRGRQAHQDPKEWEQAVDKAIAEALGAAAKP